MFVILLFIERIYFKCKMSLIAEKLGNIQSSFSSDLKKVVQWKFHTSTYTQSILFCESLNSVCIKLTKIIAVKANLQNPHFSPKNVHLNGELVYF